MIKDVVRLNGTIRRTQVCKARTKGVSVMGTPYKKGEMIVHMSSNRSTYDVFVLANKDIFDLSSNYWWDPRSKKSEFKDIHSTPSRVKKQALKVIQKLNEKTIARCAAIVAARKKS